MMLSSIFLFLSTFSLSSIPLVSADGRKVFSPGNFVCDRLNEISLDGFGLSVDTNGDFTPSTGDLSIAAYSNKFVPASIPINSPNFRVSDIEIQAICTLLVDGGTVQAPACQLEINLTYCKKIELAAEKKDGGRNLREAPDSEYDLEGKVDTARASQACFGPKTGKIMATGTGEEDYAITGGVGDFFGAFGKIKGDIVQGTFTSTGVELEYNAEIEVCYPQAYDPDY